MFECPIDYFTDNLIFNCDKSCWAAFELQGFDYDLLSDDAKIAILNKLTLFIAGISTEAKFIMIPVMQDLDAQFDTALKKLNKKDQLYESAAGQLRATQKYLKDVMEAAGSSNDYKTFVVMKLQKSDDDEIVSQLKDAFNFLVKGVINDFNAFMHTDSRDISTAKVKKFEKLAKQMYAEEDKRLSLIPCDVETVQWLIRRQMFRGINKDVKLFVKSEAKAWQPSSKNVHLAGEEYLRPKKREIINLFSGIILRGGRNIQIRHEDETSYQTFLTVTNIPDELEFPNCEWIYYIQQLNLQAEICIHIKNIEHRAALKKIEYQRRTVDSQFENISKAGAEIPEDLYSSKEAVDGLDAQLKTARSPLVQTSVVICLSSDEEETVEIKSTALRKELEDMNFIVERPLTDQFDLFLQCIPSTGFCTNDFIMNLTPMALAAGMIGATHQLGDTVGSYIGTTGIEGKLVFLNMALACLTNKAASATFYGNLGYGKSFNANLLLYLNVLCGGYGLIFDPKGERTHWKTELKALKGLINVITITSDAKYRGCLDPYNIFRDDVDLASELALNILAEYFKLKPSSLEYTALTDAISKNKKEALPSMLRLGELLDGVAKDDLFYLSAKTLARQINLMRDGGLAQLMFGNGTEDTIELTNRLNILQVQNLKLPDPDASKDDYSIEENISSVIMIVLSNFSRRFVHSFPGHFKIVLFDESWMFSKTREGQKLMHYIGRMSRSLYSGMILNGHSVNDLPGAEAKNLITYKFCFHTDSREEAVRMLEYMNLEVTSANIETLFSLENRQCLFQDLNGRVGILTFDAVFGDLIDVFSTTPVDANTAV